MTYETTPGTIPHRALQHLRSLPAGTKLATAELAEALGQPAQILTACLAHVREHGVLLAEKPTGARTFFWSLGEEEEKHLREGEMLIGEPDVKRKTKAELAESLAKYVDKEIMALAQPKLEPLPEHLVIDPKASIEEAKPEAGTFEAPACAPDVPAAPPPPAAEPEPPGAPFVPIEAGDKACWRPFLPDAVSVEVAPARWGVFSDGSFQIEKAGQRIEIERVEFESLLDFLNRTCSTQG